MSEKNIKAAGKNVAAKEILSRKKNDKKLLIFICIFMSVVIITGAIFGTVYAVRNANAALEYNGVRMSGGVARYFSSYAKALYLNSELADVEGAADTEEFWNSPEMGTKTYGEGMIEYVNQYLAGIVVGCYLYDSVANLNSEARATIKSTVEKRLLYIADGNKKEFNRIVEPFGFDYDDFYDATEMMYKVTMASYVLYGADASILRSDTEAVEEFYNSAYRRVKLLFIRTESDFNLITDENGMEVRVTNDDGTDRLFDLTPTEKSEREADIATIKQAIANFEAGEGDQMSADSFDYYLGKYKATNMHLDPGGEYYSSGSSYTARAYQEFPDVVFQSLYMAKNSYATVEIKDLGVCFIYRTELEAGAYSDNDEDGPFSDFYSALPSYTYRNELAEHLDGVSIRDKFNEIDLISLPANGTYTIGL